MAVMADRLLLNHSTLKMNGPVHWTAFYSGVFMIFYPLLCGAVSVEAHLFQSTQAATA